MIRLTRQADYAIVVMTHLARRGGSASTSARDVARDVRLSQPMVSKILKALVRGGLLLSHRGVHGGYELALHPEEISVAGIITAVEGPIGMTDCSGEPAGCCGIEHTCAVRGNWQLITSVVRRALEKITLAQMAGPLSSDLLFAAPHERLPVSQAGEAKGSIR
jgi:FeS assembly SUF system regulator